MINKLYRVAIIGLGRMGSTIDDEMPPGSPPYAIAKACQASERLQIIAGADVDPAKREAFRQRWGVQAVYADYRDMLRQEQPDLVAICTRAVLHAEMAVNVAQAGVPMIYCEKAIGCSMREVDAVREAVNRSGAKFNTGVLRRYHPRYHQARRLIAEGAIGEPRAAVHYAATNLLHGHVHSLDTLSFLLGDPKITSVWGMLLPPSQVIVDNRIGDKDPNALYQATFATGVEAASVPAGGWEFEILGTQGSLRVLNNGQGVTLRQGPDARSRVFHEVAVPTLPDTSPTLACLDDLIDAYEQGRETLGPVDIAAHITEACLAVAESHQRGVRVTLPLENKDLYIFHV